MNKILKIAWIHIEDRRVLMLRSRGKDIFYFPGGKPEGKESDVQALDRELKEELGIELQLGTVRHVGIFSAPAHGQKKPTELFCACYSGECTGKPSPHGEIEELRYFSYYERDLLTPVGKLVFEYLHEEELI